MTIVFYHSVIHGLALFVKLLSLWCVSVIVEYYFQVSFNLKVLSVVKITQNTATKPLNLQLPAPHDTWGVLPRHVLRRWIVRYWPDPVGWCSSVSFFTASLRFLFFRGGGRGRGGCYFFLLFSCGRCTIYCVRLQINMSVCLSACLLTLVFNILRTFLMKQLFLH